MIQNTIRLLSVAVAWPLMLLITAPLMAAEQEESGKWQWYGELFGFGARMDGTTAAGEDINVPLNDVLDNLDFAFMGSLAASKDKWTVFGNFIYVDIGEEATVPLAIPMPVEAELKLDMQKFISTFGAAYQVVDTGKTTFNLLAGGRYLSIDADLKYDIESVGSGREKDSGSNWDFIVGARGRTDLNEKWYIHYYADIGTGDSKSTWQAIAGINYRFSKVDVTVGYAHMDWDLDDDAMIKDMTLKGPYAGIKFRF